MSRTKHNEDISMHCSQHATLACAKPRTWLSSAACVLAITALTACGGGMSNSSTPASAPSSPSTPQSCTASTCGSMMVTMTDAAGDFLSYQVNLLSLELKKADGTLVETLPATNSVDLTQLVSLSEILSARQIPPGNYVAAQVTVDYTN